MSSVTVRNLPDGWHRDGLEQALAQQIIALFAGRILSLDTPAAQAFAKTQAGARAQGNPIVFADCAIAAFARARGFSIATRNVRDFKGTGVDLIDPWA